ncbi:DUF3868 domain-containing protein [Bacteroides congonensis]|uniref:DUF3868 domain-containing protein n=1 Tax=Bacteroides congonensis TaxID=1871006 RepID=UPI000932CEE7|nr:DUF3868 domain-containing protein [Bacteroides congonensis]
MKQMILIITAWLGTCCMLNAQQTVGVTTDSLRIERNGEYIVVDMSMGLSPLDVDVNRAVLLTPRFVCATDTLELPSIGIYGRQRYYYYVRNGESMLSGAKEMSFKARSKPSDVAYHAIMPYYGWMNGAVLELYRSDYGCCNTLLAEYVEPLGGYMEVIPLSPQLLYVYPQAEAVKSRSLSGSAFIDFPVDKTVIYPEYRQNTHELGKIQASIDSVRNDKDITITSVWLKGYASPESPYSHNRDLAIGRTAALKHYINQLYHFKDSVIVTDYEPEDWAGLRRYVEKTNLAHRTEILNMIDSNLEPDAKEAKIKRTYPEEYRFLLQNCYPALRHTDYRIDYVIRSFSDVEEIKRIMQTQPQKLSLNEFYLVARTYEPGSVEFNDVFETAVRMYPDDETANLNAANSAMQRKELESAKRYLSKSGNSPQAVYARGVYAFFVEDYDSARRLLNDAKAMGVEQAEIILIEIDKIEKAKNNLLIH